jgi:uncharacterized protein YhhL (DUF1145 family)
VTAAEPKPGTALNSALKAACLAVYLLALGGTFVLPAAGLTAVLQIAAVVLLGAHLLELLLAFRFVRRHPGPLLDSIGLTLLFGFLHWLPLARGK